MADRRVGGLAGGQQGGRAVVDWPGSGWVFFLERWVFWVSEQLERCRLGRRMVCCQRHEYCITLLSIISVIHRALINLMT